MNTLSNYAGILSCAVAGTMFGLAASQLLFWHLASALVLGLVGIIFVGISLELFKRYDAFRKQIR